MSRSELDRIYGTKEPLPERRTLSAGPLSAELENGQLRYIRFGGREVLRAISFLARDHHWGTFATEISGLNVEQSGDRFTVRYWARCAPDDGDLRFEVEIAGESSGRLSFVAHGAPVGDFTTNRTGFVVLHPLDGVASAPVQVEHASGGRETVTLPELISPHEPVRDIFAITHEAAPGLSVRVEMTGDAYDMEDHRNWTDASFKTYIRPLSKHKPYVMAAGETFEQSVVVTISGAVPVAARPSSASRIEAGAMLGTVPAMALGVEGADAPGSARALPSGISTIIGRPTTPDEVGAVGALAKAAGAELSLQFAIPGHDPAAELAPWAAAGTGAASVLVVPYRLYPLRPAGTEPGNASLEEIARAARAAFPQAAIGGGAMSGFTEFNRYRPPVADVDYLTHVTSAIVHAADDGSVVETLEALPHVFRSAIALGGGKTYRLGPCGIGLGLNPDGPPRRAGPDGGRSTMIRNDPRQRGLFAAAWTVGYARAVIAHDIAEYAPAHVVGDFGIFDDDGGLRPIYHVVRALAAQRGAVANGLSGLPTGCTGFAVGGTCWIANLTPERQTLGFRAPVRYAMLDVAAFDAARNDEAFMDRLGRADSPLLEIGPFAVVRVGA